MCKHGLGQANACKTQYHLPCAQKVQCKFLSDVFQVLCPAHAAPKVSFYVFHPKSHLGSLF